MVANSVSVAAVAIALTVSLCGAAPAVAVADATPRAVPSSTAATKLAAGLWAPKKSAKPKPRSNEDDSAREEELLRSKAAPAPRPRRRIKMEDSADSAGSDEEEEEEEEEEDRPKRKRRKVVEEEEEEEEEEEDVPLPSLPVIRPRLASGFLAAGIANRNFKYNTPLQGDSAYRMGYSFAAELYPLLLTPPGKHRHIGIGFHYGRQSGTAGRYDMATGSTITYPVKQTQWGFDVRIFFAIGPRVVLAPAIGYGRAAVDLGRRTPVMPSACLLTNADPCFADLEAAYVPLDLHVRIAASETLAFSVAGGYLFGLGVKTGEGQISTVEASATVSGFHADISTHLLIKEWFALQATIPVRRYAYKLSPLNAAATYSGATDTSWGLMAGAVFLAP
jgi:hypothetical protein